MGEYFEDMAIKNDTERITDILNHEDERQNLEHMSYNTQDAFQEHLELIIKYLKIMEEKDKIRNSNMK